MVATSLLLLIFSQSHYVHCLSPKEELHKTHLNLITTDGDKNEKQNNLVSLILMRGGTKLSKRQADFSKGMDDNFIFEVSKFGRGNEIVDDEITNDSPFTKLELNTYFRDNEDAEGLRDNFNGIKMKEIRIGDVAKHRLDDDLSGHDYFDSIYRRSRARINSDSGRSDAPKTINEVVAITEGMSFQDIFKAFNRKRTEYRHDRYDQTNFVLPSVKETRNNINSNEIKYGKQNKYKRLPKERTSSKTPFHYPDQDGNYAFQYEVQDKASGNDFGHKESKDGDVVQGYVHVYYPLDDGILTINYTLGNSSYKAKYTRPVNEVPVDA